MLEEIEVLYADSLIMVPDGVNNLEILPGPLRCVRVRFEATSTITVDLGPRPALGGAVAISMYVEVVVECDVREVDLPIAERQTPGNDAVGNLIENFEGENLTVLVGQLTEHAVVVLGIHPPEERQEDDFFMTALFETHVLEDLAALEGFPALVEPRPELAEGAAAAKEQGQDDQPSPHRPR